MKEKLHNLGITEDATCCICVNTDENSEHLFFSCDYSNRVIDQIGDWLRIVLPTQNILHWRFNRNGSKTRKAIVDATINSCMHNIWRQRNSSKYELKITHPNKLAQIIVEDRSQNPFLSSFEQEDWR
ncbi:uncharacterized protein LOC141613027 [Silene latifolia]|uniref:uncharacterized protein LOC141613027 n=1 Tax=Silene latifolia TaxID=37657 RepID=UPI003D789E96